MADGNIELENAILQEILNMGYQITPEQLDEIKQEFLRLEESSSEENGMFSSFIDDFGGDYPNLDETLMDPIGSIDRALHARDAYTSFLGTPRRPGMGLNGAEFTFHTDGVDPNLMEEFDELMKIGYDRLQKLYDEIVKMDELINEQQSSRRDTLVDLDLTPQNDKPIPNRRQTQILEDNDFGSISEESLLRRVTTLPKPKPRVMELDSDDFNLPSLDSRPGCSTSTPAATRQKPTKPTKQPLTWKTTKTLELRKAISLAKVYKNSDKAIKDLKLNPKEEKKLLREYFREHALKPVQNLKPGDIPFKHDPVARYQKYKDFWEKFPVPGDEKLEKERLKLRWMIRDLMLKWDRPVVKLVPKPQDSQPIQPEWMP